MKRRILSVMVAGAAAFGLFAAGAHPAQAHDGWCDRDRVAGWRDDYYRDRYAGYDTYRGPGCERGYERATSSYDEYRYGSRYHSDRPYGDQAYEPYGYTTYRTVRTYPVYSGHYHRHYRRRFVRTVCAPRHRLVKVVRITKIYR